LQTENAGKGIFLVKMSVNKVKAVEACEDEGENGGEHERKKEILARLGKTAFFCHAEQIPLSVRLL
jgi:hypothetical protein